MIKQRKLHRVLSCSRVLADDRHCRAHLTDLYSSRATETAGRKARSIRLQSSIFWEGRPCLL